MVRKWYTGCTAESEAPSVSRCLSFPPSLSHLTHWFTASVSCSLSLIMAKVHVVNVRVLDNPSPFNNPFQFEITFECIEDLQEDLEWKIIYVGSAESEDYDQTLDSVFVGPVPEGRHMFVFEADSPDVNKIPIQDAVGVTVVLLTCSYRGKEFIRVGYYVNNSYSDPELTENPPAAPIYDQLQRNILATNPRVTRFKIEWDDQPVGPEAGDTNGKSVTSDKTSFGTTDTHCFAGNAVSEDSHSNQIRLSDSSQPAEP